LPRLPDRELTVLIWTIQVVFHNYTLRIIREIENASPIITRSDRVIFCQHTRLGVHVRLEGCISSRIYVIVSASTYPAMVVGVAFTKTHTIRTNDIVARIAITTTIISSSTIVNARCLLIIRVFTIVLLA